jgi:hypothetical protein
MSVIPPPDIPVNVAVVVQVIASVDHRVLSAGVTVLKETYLIPLNLSFPGTGAVVERDVQVTESGDDTMLEPVPLIEPATHMDATEFHTSP